MGMLDDAFKKEPTRKQSNPFRFGAVTPKAKGGRLTRSRKPAPRRLSADFNLPSGKRKKTVAVVPYGTGRQGVFETPMVTPAPKMGTSMTVYKPKPIAVRQPKRSSGQSSNFNFQNPFGTKTSQSSGSGSNVGSSQPLGSSSGIKAGKRHKGTVVGGVGAKSRRGERGGGLSIDDSMRAGRAVGRTVVKPIGRGLWRMAGGGDTKAQKKKNRQAIRTGLRKGIGKVLFKGKKRLI